MADTGWIFAGTVATATPGDVDWTNASNATGSNTGTYASVTLDSLDVSYVLNATNFDFSSIPSGATIDGIEVAIYRQETGATVDINDDTVQLIIAGTATGANKASVSGWSGTAGEVTYGGAADVWSAAPSTADIKLSTTGVKIVVENLGNSGDARIMYVGMKVYYTSAATDWYDTNWSHRVRGYIDAALVDEAIPVVPIIIPSSASAWFAAVQADGDDIRVTADDGTTVLDHYLVSIDTATPYCILLVDVASVISTSANAYVHVYAGNAGASSTSSGSAVFTGTDIEAYYLPGMTTTDITGNGFNLTAVNSPGTAASHITGLTAASYNGTSQYHYHAGAAVSNWPITLSGIAEIDNLTTLGTIVAQASNDLPVAILSFDGTAGDEARGVFRGDSGNASLSYSSASFAANIYASAAATRNANSGTSNAYLDGGSVGADTTTVTTPTFNLLSIGALRRAVVNGYLPGSVTQAYVASVIFSANYIATEHNSWFDGDFVVWGSVETAPTGGASTTDFFWLLN